MQVIGRSVGMDDEAMKESIDPSARAGTPVHAPGLVVQTINADRHANDWPAAIPADDRSHARAGGLIAAMRGAR
jgi:hypothetical protein